MNASIAVGGAGSATFNMSGGTLNGEVGVGGTGLSVANLSGTAVLNAYLDVDAGGLCNLLPGVSLVNGRVTVNGGLLIQQGGIINSTIVVSLAGGTINLNGYNTTMYGLQSSPYADGGPGGILQTAGSTSTNLTITGGQSTNFGGTITNGTGTLGLIISGLNTIQVLSGTGNYTGATTIFSGATLQAGSTTGISPSSPVSISGGTLNLSGYSIAIPSLAGVNGTVNVTAATLTTGGSGASTTFNGNFTGTGTVQKVGAGTFTLVGGGTSTFNGTFQVSGGALANGAINGIPTAATVNLGLGGILNLNSSQALAEVTGALATVNFLNNSALTIGADNANSGFEGYLNGAGSFVKVGSGQFALGTGVNDTFASNTNITLAFNVQAGTLLLNKAVGTNAIGGPLAINGGSVVIAQGDQIADTSTVTINSGSFSLAGFNETIGGLAGTGGTLALGGGAECQPGINHDNCSGRNWRGCLHKKRCRNADPHKCVRVYGKFRRQRRPPDCLRCRQPSRAHCQQRGNVGAAGHHSQSGRWRDPVLHRWNG